MEQYFNKKCIEIKLDEEYYWSEEDDYVEFKMEDYDDVRILFGLFLFVQNCMRCMMLLVLIV